MRPDLVEQRKVVGDLLGQLRRVGDLALVEVLVLEAAMEALDHTVRARRVVAGADMLQVWLALDEAPEGVALEGGAVVGGRREASTPAGWAFIVHVVNADQTGRTFEALVDPTGNLRVNHGRDLGTSYGPIREDNVVVAHAIEQDDPDAFRERMAAVVDAFAASATERLTAQPGPWPVYYD